MNDPAESRAEGIDDLARRLIEHTLGGLNEGSEAFRSKTAQDLEWDQVQAHVQSFALSPEGGELASMLGPLPTREMAARRMTEVAEYLALLETEGEAPLRGLRDIRKAVAYASREGTLIADDLEAISRNCDVASRTGRFLRHRVEIAPTLGAIARSIDPCLELREALNHAVEPGGRLKDVASPDLGRLRRAVQNQTDRIKARVDRLLNSDRMETALQDDYFTVREDRYVLPVRVGARGRVDGIVHGYSSSGQTAFIEPQELIELNNQLRWAQIEVEEEERRILMRLSALIADNAKVLEKNARLLAYLDLVHACARFSQAIDAEPCEITEDEVKLINARHPLLYLKLKAEESDHETIPNDVVLERRNVLIVSGPNTGGKTVLLKTVGLAGLFVRAGMPIPCDEGSKVPFYEAVYTDIGDEQSIERDLSTFSSHLVNINSFIEDCGESSLVLLDELFAGTDPHQGTALAVSLLEELGRRGSTTFVTTHLENLKTLAFEDETFVNASMGFDIESLEPTYELTQGIPGSSFALRIADRLGFPKKLVERAKDVLEGEGKLSVDEIMTRLEDQVAELNKERRRLEKLRSEAEANKSRYQKKYRQLVDKDRDLVSDEAKALRKRLSEARVLLKKRLKEVKDDGTVTRKDIEDIRNELKDVEDTVSTVQEKTSAPEPTEHGLVAIEPEDLEADMDVYVGPFKREGIVLDYQQGDRDVHVQIGVMKTHVAAKDLYYPSESERQARQTGHRTPAPRERDGDVSAVQTGDNTVDLRGLRVDEATEKVELFLDSAFMKHEAAVYIIHGHGTGALKRAMRDYLPDSRYVKEWRRGERGEGGDGVTVAYLANEV